MGLVTVRDEWTKLVGHRFLNSQLCLWIGLVQAIVCMWGVAQHCHSVIHYRKILHCDFLDGSMPLEAADAVIFDIGLFHSLWGIRGCVAEYLDGGFGRLAWCVSHIISLAVSLPFAFVSRPRPCFLWPLLIQQSAYGIGLLILLIAALPRILPQLMEPHAVPVVPISVYIFGTMLNFFLLYVYWHWYWHVASLWGSAVRVRFGRVVRNANNRSRRDRPMIPKEEMLLPEALDAEALRSTAIGSKEVGMRRDSSSVSRAFKEAQEQMNGAVPNGGVREKSPQPAGNFLEVPAVSKTVRARYPQEPPVIRAMLKRGKEETGCKTEAAKKRALYKQRSSKVTTDQRRPSQSSARRRSSASTTADDASPCRKVPDA
ncbi:hypothetical protein Q1695_008003 [Nippostrongylus brasiliensis]|nr:hypothetical protein Q1695_008003 [Nippostrongylus brasiliensis]